MIINHKDSLSAVVTFICDTNKGQVEVKPEEIAAFYRDQQLVEKGFCRLTGANMVWTSDKHFPKGKKFRTFAKEWSLWNGKFWELSRIGLGANGDGCCWREQNPSKPVSF